MHVISRHWNRGVNRFGSVTQLLIVITIVVFGLQLVSTLFRLSYLESIFSLSANGIRSGFLWQLITYIFLHGGFFHIFVNMLMLWFFGREVEFFIGAKSFTKLFFLAGLMGGLLHLLFNWNSAVTIIGASAAVLGCVVAFATLFPEREITLLVFFILPVHMKARTMALLAVAFDVVALMSGLDAGVAHLAHLGGAVFGYLYIKHLGYGRPIQWLNWTKRIRVRRPQKSPSEFIEEDVDPILDKVAREGIDSLTTRERRILESARDILNKSKR